MMIRSILAFAPLLLLAACGDDDPAGENSSEQGGKAAGEVLGGTISDDMLPLEKLTSTSPPAERIPAEGEDDGETGDEAESEEAETAPSAAPVPDEPAAEPADEE